MNNPKIVFVASLFTSPVFWAQVVTAIVMVVTALGYHPAWAAQSSQAELAGALDFIATTVFQLLGYSGPVSVTAPLSTPDPQELAPGSHAVEVSQQPNTAVSVVHLVPGTHTISVAPPAAPVVPPPSLTIVNSVPA